MVKALSKPLKRLRRPPHRHASRTRSLDQAVNRLTREAERLNKQCDQQIRMTKELIERLQERAAQLDARVLDLAHAGFDFLDNDLDAGLTLARIAAEAAPNTDKRIRNCQAAHRALHTIQQFSTKWRLTEAEQRELGDKITYLKDKLDALS